ncbi:MAG TPA: beta-mannosidase [Prolixibacteraceae bacterium]|jgi:hypothetical protein|nr:beta-mannosidase [Prolixibacteraceae bacterium]
MKNLLIALLICIGIAAQAAKPVPSDPKATAETIKLYQKMLKLQSKGMMFGHQDDLPYGTTWYDVEGRSDVREVCGDYPAIFGWELGHLELDHAYSIDSVKFSKISAWIKQMDQQGAINTISWHFHNPLTGGTAWDTSSKKTVAAMLPGGEKNKLYNQYLDKLATFMLGLKDNKGNYIPILFRPFHEHTGSWFWWGKDLCTVAEYKALWRYTVTYLRDTKNIHHLLYTYSTGSISTPEEYLERYPGDDLIDILAFDSYDGAKDFTTSLANNCKIVSKLGAEKGKISAVSEVGGHIAKNPQWWTNVLLETLRPYNMSYALVWRNAYKSTKEIAYAPEKGAVSAEDFVKFYNDPKTLFLKDIK